MENKRVNVHLSRFFKGLSIIIVELVGYRFMRNLTMPNIIANYSKTRFSWS